MTGSGEYARYDLMAYRLDGEDGWRIGDVRPDLERFRAELLGRGIPVAEVCSMVRRTGPRDPQDSYWDYYRIFGSGWTRDDVAGCWRAPGEMICTPPGDPAPADGIEVFFDAAEWGWQPVRIAAGGQADRFVFSHIYSPFRRILRWLEAIALGSSVRISANMEGYFLELFAFTLPDPARVRIAIAHAPHEEDASRDVRLDFDADRRGFIAAFYGAMRAYGQSERYVIEHWAGLAMRDDLARRGCPIDPVRTAALDTGSLNALMWQLYPEGDIAPDLAGGVKEPGRSSGYVPRGQQAREMQNPVWVIDEDYDAWDTARRAAYIEDMIGEPVTPFGGSNFKTLRSRAIERFLNASDGDGTSAPA